MKEGVLRLLLITSHKTLACTRDIIFSNAGVRHNFFACVLHYEVNFKILVL